MNNKQRAARSGSVVWMVFALIISLAVYGCGSSGTESKFFTGQKQAGVIVEPDQQLSGYPHLFDIYRATNARNAIVFLHGIGITKQEAANQFGIVDSSDNTVNKEVLIANRALAVFPQGQALATAPTASTWSNYVTNSGLDDMSFIRDLVGHIKAKYKISRFYVVGHSTGGMLANRIWCEQADLFDGYVAIAGPPAEHFSAAECSPENVKPYLGIVRTEDWVLGQPGEWEDPTWTVQRVLVREYYPPAAGAFLEEYPKVVGEYSFLQTRKLMRCGYGVGDSDVSGVTDGLITKWSFCEDSIRLLNIDVDPGEGMEELQNEVWGFLSR